YASERRLCLREVAIAKSCQLSCAAHIPQPPFQTGSQAENSSHFSAKTLNSKVATNQVAVALWKKMGFEVVGTLPRAYRHARLGLVDCLVMYRWLGEPDPAA
ncbi:MAG: hypothetical protein VB138_04370, partial [Burkholderia sp.]